MIVEDPNVIPATIAVGSIPPVAGAAFVYGGVPHLILTGGQIVNLTTGALVSIPATTQVYQRSVAKVIFAAV